MKLLSENNLNNWLKELSEFLIRINLPFKEVRIIDAQLRGLIRNA